MYCAIYDYYKTKNRCYLTTVFMHNKKVWINITNYRKLIYSINKHAAATLFAASAKEDKTPYSSGV